MIRPTPPLSANRPSNGSRSRQAGLTALLAHARNCLKRRSRLLKGCLAGFSDDDVHGVRVETRRLLAASALIAPLLPADVVADARHALRQQLKATSTLRDVHVQLSRIDSLKPSHPELKSFRRHLRRRERRATRHAEKILGRARFARRIAQLKKAIDRVPAVLSPQAARGFVSSLRRTLEGVAARIAQCQRKASTQAKWLHRMRVAAKTYRYMLEALPARLAQGKEKRLRALRALQRHSGEAHDLALLETRLVKFARAKHRAKALESCRQELAPRRARIDRDLAATMNLIGGQSPSLRRDAPRLRISA